MLGLTRGDRVDLTFTHKAIEQKFGCLRFAKPSDLSGFLAAFAVNCDETLVNKILSLVNLPAMHYLDLSHKSPSFN